MSVHVVWFRADLDVTFHAPLARAAAIAPVICLYAYDSTSLRAECLPALNARLTALDAALTTLGGRLTLRPGPVTGALEALHARHRVAALWSHHDEDTAQDAAVLGWTRARGIPWKVLVPAAERPGRVQVPTTVDHGMIPDAPSLGLTTATAPDTCARAGQALPSGGRETEPADHP